MEPQRRLPTVGGRACLAFANTLEGERGEQPHEHVPDFGRLVAWARHARVLDAARAGALEREARRRPADAQRVHRRAIRLREAIFQLVSRTIHGQGVASEDLDALNVELGRALAHARIASSKRGFAWTWEAPAAELEQLLWPIARSAAELLASPDIERVRECPGDNCDDLFIDTTRNGRRRWCKMSVCGNRAKANSFRARERSTRRRRK